MGILHALHESYPAARIAWAVQPEFAGILRGVPGLERVIPFDRRGGFAAWLRMRREVRSFAPQWVVDAQGNWKSASVTLAAGARRRTGYARPDWREPAARFALNDPAPATPPELSHAIARVSTLVDHIARGATPRFDLALTPAEIEHGRRRLERLVPGEGRAILLHLSSPGDVRSWPIERWTRLALELRRRDARVVVLSGPAEEDAVREIEPRLPKQDGWAYWAGTKDLRELAGTFRAAVERGGVLVTCDSGPMHVAWASGLRVVVLEGPCSAARTGPWPERGAGHVEVRAEAPPPCAPCFAKRCTHPSGTNGSPGSLGPVCMADITTEQVVRAID